MSLIFKSLTLSSNPTAIVGKVGEHSFNVTVEKDNSRKPRLYLVGTFQDGENPFSPIRTRAITQQYDATGNPVWRVDIDMLRTMIGQTFPGDVVTLETEPFVIREGQKPASSYTAVVFKHETAKSVFLNSGRVPKGVSRTELPPRFANAAIIIENHAEAEVAALEANPENAVVEPGAITS